MAGFKNTITKRCTCGENKFDFCLMNGAFCSLSVYRCRNCRIVHTTPKTQEFNHWWQGVMAGKIIQEGA